MEFTVGNYAPARERNDIGVTAPTFS